MKLLDARTQIEVIPTDECLHLLTTKQVGRLGFISGSRPEILPVNYALDGEAIVFATAPGSKLWGVTRSVATFEIDDIDETLRSGWSVIVHGLAQEVTEHDERLLERIRRLPLSSWVPGDKPSLVRIAPTSITGRRVSAPERSAPGPVLGLAH